MKAGTGLDWTGETFDGDPEDIVTDIPESGPVVVIVSSKKEKSKTRKIWFFKI